LPGTFRQLLGRLGEHLKELDRQVGELEQQIQRWHRENEASRELEKIQGICLLSASAYLGGHDRGCKAVRERPSAGDLAGIGTPAAFQRRQDNQLRNL